MARRKKNKRKNNKGKPPAYSKIDKQAKVDRRNNDAPRPNGPDLMLWLSQMNLSDEEFVRQFQQIAMTGDFDSVQKLMPWLPEDAYFDDTCTRSQQVLDAGHQAVFVLLARTEGYKRRNPLERICVVVTLLTLALVAFGIYVAMYVE
jgi:hypothetical protein